MTHHMPGRGTLPAPAVTISQPMPVLHPAALPTPARLDRAALRIGVALRRERLARLEAELVAACEAAACRGDLRTSAPDDRALWDRTTGAATSTPRRGWRAATARGCGGCATTSPGWSACSTLPWRPDRHGQAPAAAPGHAESPTLLLRADEAWTHAFQAVMARCQKGDLLVLTRNIQANALRYCDFDRPVTFMAQGEAVCTFAGGIREVR